MAHLHISARKIEQVPLPGKICRHRTGVPYKYNVIQSGLHAVKLVYYYNTCTTQEQDMQPDARRHAKLYISHNSN